MARNKTTGAKAPSSLKMTRYTDEPTKTKPTRPNPTVTYTRLPDLTPGVEFKRLQPDSFTYDPWGALNDAYRRNSSGLLQNSYKNFHRYATFNGDKHAEYYYKMNQTSDGPRYTKVYPTFKPYQAPAPILKGDEADPYKVDNFGEAFFTAFNPNMTGHTANPFYNFFKDVFTITYEQNIQPIVNSFKKSFTEGFTDSKTDKGYDFYKAFSSGEGIKEKGLGVLAAALQDGAGLSAINTLANVGNTVDALTFSNTVKSIVLGTDGKFGGKDGGFKWDNIQKSLWGTKEGTVLYEANYDNTIGNIAVEMLLDVGNWVTFGGKSLAKAVTTTNVASQVTDRGANIMTKKVNKTLAKKAINSFVSGDYDTMTEAFQTIAQKYGSGGYLVPIRNVSKDDVMKIIGDTLLASKEVKANKVLTSVRGLTKAYNTYEDAVLKLALTGTGLRPLWLAAGNTVRYVGEKNTSAMYNHLKAYLDPNENIDIARMSDAREQLEAFISVTNKANTQSLEPIITVETIDALFGRSLNKQLRSLSALMIDNAEDITILKAKMCELFGIDADEPMEYVSKTIKQEISKMADKTNYKPLEDLLETIELNYKKIVQRADGQAVITKHKNLEDIYHAVKQKLYDFTSPLKEGTLEHYIAFCKHVYDNEVVDFKRMAQMAQGFSDRVEIQIHNLRKHGEAIEKYLTDVGYEHPVGPVDVSKLSTDKLYNYTLQEYVWYCNTTAYNLQKMNEDEILEELFINEFDKPYNESIQAISDMSIKDLKKTLQEYGGEFDVEKMSRQDLLREITLEKQSKGELITQFSGDTTKLRKVMQLLEPKMNRDWRRKKLLTEDLTPVKTFTKYLDGATTIHGKFYSDFLKDLTGETTPDAFREGIQYNVTKENIQNFKKFQDDIRGLLDKDIEGLYQHLATITPRDAEDILPGTIFNAGTFIEDLKAVANMCLTTEESDKIFKETGVKVAPVDCTVFSDTIRRIERQAHYAEQLFPEDAFAHTFETKVVSTKKVDGEPFAKLIDDLRNTEKVYPNPVEGEFREFLNTSKYQSVLEQYATVFKKDMDYDEFVLAKKKLELSLDLQSKFLQTEWNKFIMSRYPDSFFVDRTPIKEMAPISLPHTELLSKYTHIGVYTDVKNSGKFLDGTIFDDLEKAIAKHDDALSKYNIQRPTVLRDLYTELKKAPKDVPSFKAIMSKYEALIKNEDKELHKLTHSKYPRYTVTPSIKVLPLDLSAYDSVKSYSLDDKYVAVDTVTFNVKEALNDIFEEMKLLNPDAILEQEIDINIEGNVYQLMLERSYASAKIADDPTMMQFIEGYNNHSGLGGFIKELASLDTDGVTVTDDLISVAKELEQYVSVLSNYYDLQNDIALAEISEKTKTHFISALQWLGEENPTDVQGRFNSYFDDTIDIANNLTYSKEMEHSLSIDKLITPELQSEVDAIYKGNAAQKHTALYDNYREEVIIKSDPKLRKVIEEDFKDYTVVLYDIETTDSKYYNSVLSNIGAKVYGDTSKDLSLFKNFEDGGLDIPSEAILKRMYEGETLTPSEMINRYVEMIKANATGSELDNMKKFIEYLRGMDNPVLAGHNITVFDDPYMQGKLRMWVQEDLMSADDYNFLKQIPRIDTLKIMKDNLGLGFIDDHEKLILKNIMRRYVDRAVETTGTKLIQTASFDFTEKLRAFSNVLTRKNVYRNHKDNTFALKAAEFSRDASELAQTTTTNMQEVRRLNKQLKDSLLFDSLIKDETYNDRLAEYLTAGGYDKALIDSVKTHLNMTKFMYSALPDGMYMYGYKNIISTSAIQEWFDLNNLPSAVKYTRRLAEKLTSIGKNLNRTASAIKRADILMNIGADKIQEAINVLAIKHDNAAYNALYSGEIDLAEFFNRVPIDPRNTSSYLAAFKYDKQNIAQQWALLQYLYNCKVNRTAIEGHMLGLGKIDPEVLKYLTDKQANSSLFKMKHDTYMIVDPLKYVWNGDSVDIEGYANLGADIGNLIKNEQNLARRFDDIDITLNQSQLIAHSLTPMKNFMDNVVDVFKKATPTERAAIADEVRHATNLGHMDVALQIFNYTPTQLLDHMITRAPYFVTNVSHLNNEHPLKIALDKLMSQTKELKELGINVIDKDNKIMFYLDRTKRIDIVYDATTKSNVFSLNGRIVTAPKLKPVAYKIDKLPGLAEAINSVYNMTSGKAIGSNFNVMSKEKAYALYKNLPEELQKLIDVESIMHSHRYSGVQFDYTNIGDIDSIRSFDKYAPTSVLSTLKNNAEHFAVTMQTKTQYTQHFFNSSFSINSGTFAEVHPERLKEYLESHPNFVLVGLASDTKKGFKAVPINPKVEGWYGTAKRLNAILVPAHTYSTMNHVLNDSVPGPVMQTVKRIMTMYKLGYLWRPVTVFNNYVDSTLKTAMTSGSVLNTIRYQLRATQDLKKYDDILNNVMNLSQFDVAELLKAGVSQSDIDALVKLKVNSFKTAAMDLLNKYTDISSDLIKMDYNRRLTRDNMKLYFDSMHPELDYHTFTLIDNLIKSNASPGMTSTMQKVLQGRMQRDHKGLSKMWDGYLTANNFLMTPMEWVEQVNRFALFMMENDKGATITDAIASTVKTHFDYASKSNLAQMMELVFPFFSFTQKNINYYLDLFAHKPHLAALSFKYANATWSYDDYSEDELAENQSLQNQILNGMIPISSNGDVLKVRPSFMDVFNMYTNPIEAAKGKVFGPYKELSKYGTPEFDITQFIPYLGTASNSIKTMKANKERMGKQGSSNLLNLMLPGVFGMTTRWRDFPKYEKQQVQFPKRKMPKGYWGDNKFQEYKDKFYYNGRGYRPYSNTNRMYMPSKYYPKFANSAYRPTLEAGRGYDPLNYPNNFHTKVRIYEKQYTKKGKSRMTNRVATTTGYNLRYKINDWRYCR